MIGKVHKPAVGEWFIKKCRISGGLYTEYLSGTHNI